jgi:tRNA dimethylallyltransferase
MTSTPADNRSPLIVICGPTASGKTRLGIELALRFNGEVVNADSRYLYRGMDIGVAKPSPAERAGVLHHLIDIREPNEEMSLATYQELAYAAIDDIHARGKLPLLVGGTPLYVNAVVEGWRIPRVPPDPVFRARIEQEIADRGLDPVWARLARVDPVSAERSEKNARRVIRALEIYQATGQPMSEIEGKGPPPYRALELGLDIPRAALHAAIDGRVDWQIGHGLVDEVARLLEAGVSPDAPAMSSIGYRQLLPFLRGFDTLNEAARQIKVDTHRYVRHQETWLRKNPRLIPIFVTQTDWIAQASQLVEAFLSGTSVELLGSRITISNRELPNPPKPPYTRGQARTPRRSTEARGGS